MFCFFIAPALLRKSSDIARAAAPAAKIVFHPVDLHFLRMQREAALTQDAAQLEAAQTMRATELDLIRRQTRPSS